MIIPPFCWAGTKGPEQAALAPPVVGSTEGRVEDVYGLSVADPYRWMEEPSMSFRLGQTAETRATILIRMAGSKAYLFNRFQALAL